MELFESAFQTGGILEHRLCVLENFLKTELFENDGATIIMWLHYPSFPQMQI